MHKIKFLIAAATAIILILACGNNSKYTGSKIDSTLKKDAPPDTAIVRKGKYIDYSYTFGDSSNKIVAVFPEKPLPKDNDAIAVGAVKNIIFKAFKEDIPGSSPASYEKRGNVGLIKIPGKDADYFSQQIKTSSSETKSLIIWKEPR
jgi:hypothetical protein